MLIESEPQSALKQTTDRAAAIAVLGSEEGTLAETWSHC